MLPEAKEGWEMAVARQATYLATALVSVPRFGRHLPPSETPAYLTLR